MVLSALILTAALSVTRQLNAGKVGPMVCDVPAGTTSIKYDVAPGCGGWGSVPVTPNSPCTRVPIVKPQIGQPYYAAAACVGTSCGPYVPEAALSCAGQTASGGCDPKMYHASEPVPASESFSSLHLAPGVTSGDCTWSHDMGGSNSADGVSAFSVATDEAGNVYATGSVVNSADFGGVILTTSGTNHHALFVAKWNSAGSLLWAVKFEGDNTSEGEGIAADHSGGVVISGYFWGTINFGGGNLVSNGFGDAFILKVSAADGSYVWAKKRGGTNIDQGSAIAVDTADNVFAVGFFQGTVDFVSSTLVSAGGKDVFVTKLSSDGTAVWAKGYGGTGLDLANAVEVDSLGIVAVGGVFSGTANFDGTVLVSAGSTDGYVATLLTNGTIHWIKRFGGTGGETLAGLAISSTRSIAVIGDFASTVNFGTVTLVNTGTGDAYLAAYDACGTNIWAKQYSSSQETALYPVTGKTVGGDTSGNFLVGCEAVDAVDFGTGLLTGNSIDPVVFKVNGTGTTLWAKRAVQPYDDHIYDLASDPSDNVLSLGTFWETFDFGCGQMTSPNPTGTDGWLVKFVP